MKQKFYQGACLLAAAALAVSVCGVPFFALDAGAPETVAPHSPAAAQSVQIAEAPEGASDGPLNAAEEALPQEQQEPAPAKGEETAGYSAESEPAGKLLAGVAPQEHPTEQPDPAQPGMEAPGETLLNAPNFLLASKAEEQAQDEGTADSAAENEPAAPAAEGGPVELWKGYATNPAHPESEYRLGSYSSLTEALAAAEKSQFSTKVVYIRSDYTLTEDAAIPAEVGLYIYGRDNGGTYTGAAFTIAQGASLTVSEGCSKLAVMKGCTLRVQGKVLIEGGSYSALTQKSVVNIAADASMEGELSVPEGKVLYGTGGYYWAAPPEEAAALLTTAAGDIYYCKALPVPEEGCTITLLKDLESSLIISKKNVTLDLGGHTLKSKQSATAPVLTVLETGFVLKNGTLERGGSSSSALEIQNAATVAVRADALIEGGAQYGIVILGAGSDLTVEGTVRSSGSFAISGNGNGDYNNTTLTVKEGAVIASTAAAGIYHPQAGTLNILGGHISGTTGVEIRSGTLNITGGSVAATGAFSEQKNENGATTSGAGVAVVQHTTQHAIQVNISGGTISGEAPLYEKNIQQNPPESIQKVKIQVTGGSFMATKSGAAAVYSENVKGFLTGGEYSSDISAYMAKGYLARETEGVWNIVENIVAQINDVGYRDLQSAIDAAQAGQSVRLLQDVALESSLILDKAITLNLGGKTITGTVSIGGSGQNVTITGGGTLRSEKEKSENAPLYVCKGAAATLDGVTLDCGGVKNSYAASVYGTLRVKDATLRNADYGFACFGDSETLIENADVQVAGHCISTGAAGSPGACVTVQGGSFTSTDEGWSNCPVYWAGHGVLKIEGGSFNGHPGAAAGIYQKNGTVNITGGSFSARDGIKLGAESPDCTGLILNVSGGSFTGVRSGLYFKTTDSGSNCKIYTISIRGGSFSGKDKGALYPSIEGNVIKPAAFISGGQFNTWSADTYGEYLAAGCVAAGPESGFYTVGLSSIESALEAVLKQAEEALNSAISGKTLAALTAGDLESAENRLALQGQKAAFTQCLTQLNALNAAELENYLAVHPEAKLRVENLKKICEAALDVKEAAAAAQAKVETVALPQPPAGLPADMAPTAQDAAEKGGALAAELTGNAAVNNTPAAGLAGAVELPRLAEQLPPGAAKVELTIQVTLTDIELQAVAQTNAQGNVTGAALVPRQLVFDVTPIAKATLASGGAHSLTLTGEMLNGQSIRFRLPIPADVAETYARVAHPGDADRYARIEGTGTEKYVELEAASFSPYTVTFTNTLPQEKPEEKAEGNHSAGAEPQPAQPQGYDWYSVLSQIQALGSSGSLRVDVAQEIAVPNFIWQAIWGKNISLTLVRGLDAFTFNGARLKTAGFDPNSGHNLTDLAGYRHGAAAAAGVKTGDPFPVRLVLLAALGSALGLGWLALTGKKRRPGAE